MTTKMLLVCVESEGPIDVAQIFAAAQVMQSRPAPAPIPPPTPAQLPAATDAVPSRNGVHKPAAAAKANGTAQVRATRSKQSDTDRRDAIAKFLLQNGASNGATVQRGAGIAGASTLYKALDHNWFAKTDDGKWELTPGGRAAAKVVAAT